MSKEKREGEIGRERESRREGEWRGEGRGRGEWERRNGEGDREGRRRRGRAMDGGTEGDQMRQWVKVMKGIAT